MTVSLRRFLKDQGGATAIEYGLICGLIFLAIVTAVTLFTGEVTGMFEYIRSTLVGVL